MAQQSREPRVLFHGNIKFSDASLGQTISETDKNSPQLLTRTILDFYHQRGYAFVQLTSESNIDSVVMQIKEGPFCILSQVNIDSDSLVDPSLFDIPQKYIAADVNATLQNWLFGQELTGHPLATVLIDSIEIRSSGPDTAYILINFIIENMDEIRIGPIIVTGTEYTEPDIALRELSWAKGLKFTPQIRDEMKESIDKLRIFEFVDKPQLIKTDSGTVVVVDIEEGQNTYFDGIIGYIPPSQSATNETEGYFTGLIDLKFNNLFGTARKLFIHWEKPDALSDAFAIQYKEPWILGIPLNGIGGFHRRVQDTLFIKQGYNIELEYPLSYNWRLYAKIEKNFTIPDSIAVIERGISDNTHTKYITGIRYDSRDFPQNPRAGMWWDLNFAFGNKKIDGPESYFSRDSTAVANQSSQTLKIKGALFFEIFSRQVVTLKIDGSYLDVYPGVGDDADLFWFGGAGSFRGYRERQFKSDKVVITSFEYRLLYGPRSRLFAFVDYAVFNNEDIIEKKLGYGIGIRQQTALGVIAIDYGLAEGDPFSQGKIHFGLVNDF